MEGILLVLIIFVIALIFVICAIIVGKIPSDIKKQKEEQELQKLRQLQVQKAEKNKLEQIYQNYKRSSMVPENAYCIGLENISFWIWKEQDFLCFNPRIKNIDDIRYWISHNNNQIRVKDSYIDLPSPVISLDDILQIPLSNIKYFSAEGEFYRENKIAGGGGGGSSLTGAVVGGVIAGSAGAIIGSRKKIDDITSTVIEHDTRCTILSYVDDSGIEKVMTFDYSAFKVLNDIIPEKEYDRVQAIQTANIVAQTQAQTTQQTNTDMIFDSIQKLAQLKESGIISSSEFEIKKGELLARL